LKFTSELERKLDDTGGQELTSRLGSRTLRPVNVLGLLVFSNNIKNSISDI